MFDAILGSLFGSKTVTKKVASGKISDRTKKRKLIIQKFRSVNPNDNSKRAKIAKELLNVSRTEGERKAARKFYKDETELNNLKEKINDSDSINEKLSLARQGKRLATKKQKEFWENLINKLQKSKQNRSSAIANKKEVSAAAVTDKDKEREEYEDMEEKQEQDIEENETGNDTEKPEEDGEEETEGGESDEDENENKDEDEDEEELNGIFANDMDEN